MSRTFPRSKHLNLTYERVFGAYAANQEMRIAAQCSIFQPIRTQRNRAKFCAANQERENPTMAP